MYSTSSSKGLSSFHKVLKVKCDFENLKFTILWALDNTLFRLTGPFVSNCLWCPLWGEKEKSERCWTWKHHHKASTSTSDTKVEALSLKGLTMNNHNFFSHLKQQLSTSCIVELWPDGGAATPPGPCSWCHRNTTIQQGSWWNHTQQSVQRL